MANSKLDKKLSIAFSYGFTEGKAHSRLLSKSLTEAGYVIADDPSAADIVIAHSAGCWYNLDKFNPKLLFYVGMPLPMRNTAAIFLEANRISVARSIKGGKSLRLIKSLLLNFSYIFIHPLRNFRIIYRARHAQPVKFQDISTVFIANKYDPWPHSERLDELVRNENWSFVGFSGAHNNIWRDTDKYVNIINHYARLLAKTNKR